MSYTIIPNLFFKVFSPSTTNFILCNNILNLIHTFFSPKTSLLHFIVASKIAYYSPIGFHTSLFQDPHLLSFPSYAKISYLFIEDYIFYPNFIPFIIFWEIQLLPKSSFSSLTIFFCFPQLILTVPHASVAASVNENLHVPQHLNLTVLFLI